MIKRVMSSAKSHKMPINENSMLISTSNHNDSSYSGSQNTNGKSTSNEITTPIQAGTVKVVPHNLKDTHLLITSPNASSSSSSSVNEVHLSRGLEIGSPKPNQVSTVLLYGIPIVSLYIESQERLCLAQISNTLLKQFSYNEIHNRRVALGITCVQCTPVQLEILRRAGAMPVSSRRCGMITRREAERLCKSFLGDNSPPRLPDDFAFSVHHECAWGCCGSFLPSRYNSSRAKCIKCSYCGLFFSPNKFIFHSHRIGPADKYVQPDAANFNSWRRHMKLSGSPPEEITHAWEDVKAMFNGGTRKRLISNDSSGSVSSSSGSHHTHHRHSNHASGAVAAAIVASTTVASSSSMRIISNGSTSSSTSSSSQNSKAITTEATTIGVVDSSCSSAAKRLRDYSNRPITSNVISIAHLPHHHLNHHHHHNSNHHAPHLNHHNLNHAYNNHLQHHHSTHHYLDPINQLGSPASSIATTSRNSNSNHSHLHQHHHHLQNEQHLQQHHHAASTHEMQHNSLATSSETTSLIPPLLAAKCDSISFTNNCKTGNVLNSTQNESTLNSNSNAISYTPPTSNAAPSHMALTSDIAAALPFSRTFVMDYMWHAQNKFQFTNYSLPWMKRTGSLFNINSNSSNKNSNSIGERDLAFNSPNESSDDSKRLLAPSRSTSNLSSQLTLKGKNNNNSYNNQSNSSNSSFNNNINNNNNSKKLETNLTSNSNQNDSSNCLTTVTNNCNINVQSDKNEASRNNADSSNSQNTNELLLSSFYKKSAFKPVHNSSTAASLILSSPASTSSSAHLLSHPSSQHNKCLSLSNDVLALAAVAKFNSVGNSNANGSTNNRSNYFNSNNTNHCSNLINSNLDNYHTVLNPNHRQTGKSNDGKISATKVIGNNSSKSLDDDKMNSISKMQSNIMHNSNYRSSILNLISTTAASTTTTDKNDNLTKKAEILHSKSSNNNKLDGNALTSLNNYNGHNTNNEFDKNENLNYYLLGNNDSNNNNTTTKNKFCNRDLLSILPDGIKESLSSDDEDRPPGNGHVDDDDDEMVDIETTEDENKPIAYISTATAILLSNNDGNRFMPKYNMYQHQPPIPHHPDLISSISQLNSSVVNHQNGQKCSMSLSPIPCNLSSKIVLTTRTATSGGAPNRLENDDFFQSNINCSLAANELHLNEAPSTFVTSNLSNFLHRNDDKNKNNDENGDENIKFNYNKYDTIMIPSPSLVTPTTTSSTSNSPTIEVDNSNDHNDICKWNSRNERTLITSTTLNASTDYFGKDEDLNDDKVMKKEVNLSNAVVIPRASSSESERVVPHEKNRLVILNAVRYFHLFKNLE